MPTQTAPRSIRTLPRPAKVQAAVFAETNRVTRLRHAPSAARVSGTRDSHFNVQMDFLWTFGMRTGQKV